MGGGGGGARGREGVQTLERKMFEKKKRKRVRKILWPVVGGSVRNPCAFDDYISPFSPLMCSLLLPPPRTDDPSPSSPPSSPPSPTPSTPPSSPQDSTVSIYECGSCGYTLFPAKGREFKFFPEDYVCPECGGAREGFIERSAGS